MPCRLPNKTPSKIQTTMSGPSPAKVWTLDLRSLDRSLSHPYPATTQFFKVHQIRGKSGYGNDALKLSG